MKSCFMKEQPHEYYPVEFNGEVVATFRDLTGAEKDYLYSTYLAKGMLIQYNNGRISKMLGCDKKVGNEGWIFDEKPTLEILDRLSRDNPELYVLLEFHTNKINQDYLKNKEGIVKNLEQQLGSS